MRWGLVLAGLATLAVLAIISWLIIASDYPISHSNGIWVFFVIFPIGIPVASAAVLAGVDASNQETRR